MKNSKISVFSLNIGKSKISVLVQIWEKIEKLGFSPIIKNSKISVFSLILDRNELLIQLKVIGWPSILTSHMHPMINYIDYEKGLIRHLSVKPIEWNHYCRGRRLIWIECSCSGAPPSLEDSTLVAFLTKGMQDIKEIWPRKNQKIVTLENKLVTE